MPSRKKVDLKKVLASLDTICPACGHRITPAEIKRLNMDEMECPACGAKFATGKDGPRTS